MKSHFVVKGASKRNFKDTLGVNKSMGVSKVDDIQSPKFCPNSAYGFIGLLMITLFNDFNLDRGEGGFFFSTF